MRTVMHRYAAFARDDGTLCELPYEIRVVIVKTRLESGTCEFGSEVCLSCLSAYFDEARHEKHHRNH
jgi:hypothetical protein